MKRIAGGQLDGSLQERRMTAGDEGLVDECSDGEEPRGGHSQLSSMRSQPKGLPKAS